MQDACTQLLHFQIYFGSDIVDETETQNRNRQENWLSFYVVDIIYFIVQWSTTGPPSSRETQAGLQSWVN